MKQLFSLYLICLIAVNGSAQGSLTGVVKKQKTDELIPFAKVSLDGVIRAESGFDGDFEISGMTEGKHIIKIEGFECQALTDTIDYSSDNKHFVFSIQEGAAMSIDSIDFDRLVRENYRQLKGGVVTREDTTQMPTRQPLSVQPISSCCRPTLTSGRQGCLLESHYYGKNSALPKGRKHYRYQVKALKKNYGRKLTTKEKEDLKLIYLR